MIESEKKEMQRKERKEKKEMEEEEEMRSNCVFELNIVERKLEVSFNSWFSLICYG